MTNLYAVDWVAGLVVKFSLTDARKKWCAEIPGGWRREPIDPLRATLLINNGYKSMWWGHLPQAEDSTVQKGGDIE